MSLAPQAVTTECICKKNGREVWQMDPACPEHAQYGWRARDAK